MDQQQNEHPMRKAPGPTLAERVAWVAGLAATFAGTYAYNKPTHAPEPPAPVQSAERVQITPQAAPVATQRPEIGAMPTVLRVDTVRIEAGTVELVGNITVAIPEIKVPAAPNVTIECKVPPANPAPVYVENKITVPRAEVVPTDDPTAGPAHIRPIRIWPKEKE